MHSTMERSVGASFGGRDEGVLGDGPGGNCENPGFPNSGLAISDCNCFQRKTKGQQLKGKIVS